MLCVDETCARLQQDLSRRGCRFSPDEVLHRLSLVCGPLPDLSLFVKHTKLFDDPGDPIQHEFLLMNYLSFSILNGELHRFDSREDCYAAFRAASAAICYDEPAISIACGLNEYRLNEATIKNIANVMSTFFYLYTYEGIMEAAATRFQKTLVESPEPYSVDDLLGFVIANYPIDGLSLLHCKFCDHEVMIDSIRMVDFGINSSGILTNISRSLSSELRIGRPIDGFQLLRDDKWVRYTVLSASSQNWKAQLGDGEAKFVVLFSTDRGVDEFISRFIRDGLKRTAEADRAKQLHILNELDRITREFNRQVSLNTLRFDWQRREFIYRDINAVAASIYGATYAHSVTLRLFNPFSESLECVAECAFASGKYKAKEPNAIPITRLDSVNVKTFKEKGPNEYTYVPVMPLLEAGAEIEFYNPRDSASEICFPIWQMAVPVGTLNLESPRRHAFGGEILFLQSAARLVGDLLHSVNNILPPEAVTQIARINETAHGSLSLTEDPDPQEMRGLPVTIQKTLDEFMALMRRYRSPVEERPIDATQCSLRAVLREAVEAEIIDFRCKQLDWNRILPAQDVMISTFEARNIKAVLKFVIDNAEKHSSFIDDYCRTFVIYRGLYSFFIIRYRSDHRPISAEAAMEFGLRPFAREGRVSYGAFLLAASVRSMGGLLHVKRPARDQTGLMPLELAIILPLGTP